MKIEIVVDPTRVAPAASLAARVAPPPAAAAAIETTPRLVIPVRDTFDHVLLEFSTLMRLSFCVELVDGLVGDVVAEGERTRGRRRLWQIWMPRWRYATYIYW